MGLGFFNLRISRCKSQIACTGKTEDSSRKLKQYYFETVCGWYPAGLINIRIYSDEYHPTIEYSDDIHECLTYYVN